MRAEERACSPSAARLLAVTGGAAGHFGVVDGEDRSRRPYPPSQGPLLDRLLFGCSPPQFAARCAPESGLRPESRGIERQAAGDIAVASLTTAEQLHLLPEMSRRLQVQLASTADIEEEEN